MDEKEFSLEVLDVFFGGTSGIILRILLAAVIGALGFWFLKWSKPYLSKLIRRETTEKRFDDAQNLRQENRTMEANSERTEDELKDWVEKN